ncbi:uncharacterized protein LOC122638879 [Telopea speciosissima]|uniref:uncharacterized protein LOC122638879 n=1 Tax=Telopea speciosissima TaxID=54955 RepID=UPI001CC82B4F|nr:uncharacterized protein LOC122638879 [Telopea speciosissima]
MEKTFTMIDCTKDCKIRCAVYMLKGETDDWLRLTEPNLVVTHPNLTWEQVKEAFFENYFPESYCERKAAEFIDVTQGSKSVLKYQQKFEELFHFAPIHLKDDVEKGKRFEKASSLPTGGSIQCYNCNKYGHISKVCPQPKPWVSWTTAQPLASQTSHSKLVGKPPLSTQGNRIPAQAYIMTDAEAEATPRVLTGTISIASIPIYVLFDSGASHSFASSSFDKKMGSDPKGLVQGLAVSTPTGSVVGLDIVYEPHPVLICDRDTIAHLVELDMKDYDVIFGIDWLATYKANLACVEHQIVFKPTDGEEFVFKGDRKKRSKRLIILTLQAKRHMDQGCECYLASVIDMEAKVKPLEELGVVTDFSDMFSDDLTELLPNKETEFAIDLLLGVALVSNAPYRMAPTELKELQKQVQDLLKKGFIRPSVSP